MEISTIKTGIVWYNVNLLRKCCKGIFLGNDKGENFIMSKTWTGRYWRSNGYSTRNDRKEFEIEVSDREYELLTELAEDPEGKTFVADVEELDDFRTRTGKLILKLAVADAASNEEKAFMREGSIAVGCLYTGIPGYSFYDTGRNEW